MAGRLAEGSDVFDFERALDIVRHRPTGAEALVRMDEEMKRRQEDRVRRRERRRRALIEDFF
ncbi:MAG TPA: hypothetical protein VFK14_02110 [Solirubrobacterales bacterium]|nr:hypothetical protein [Solirubrobacterales bacterium]